MGNNDSREAALLAERERNDIKAAAMAEALDREHDELWDRAQKEISDAALPCDVTIMSHVALSFDYRAVQDALKEKYPDMGRRDIEVRLSVTQNKPECWWEHVAGPWPRRPSYVEKSIEDALSDQALEILREYKDVDAATTDTYSEMIVTFDCPVDQTKAICAKLETELRDYLKFLALAAEQLLLERKKEAEEEEAECARSNNYREQEGSLWIGLERDPKSGGRHRDCIIETPNYSIIGPNYRPNEIHRHVVEWFDSREEAVKWLRDYAKMHPERNIPPREYGDTQ